jgi:phosphogluconate dehydratase
MSGASGSVPAAIHVTPECSLGGPLARVRDGDMIRLNSRERSLEVLVSDSELAARASAKMPNVSQFGAGRELFGPFRKMVSTAEEGAIVCL